MAINLLIDTSNLIQLLNILENDRNLHKLDVWLKNREIRLYMLSVIANEWKLHKDKKLLGVELPDIYCRVPMVKIIRTFREF